MEKAKILVLLVHYNTPELVPDVLNSIQENKVDVTILIVDNGSSIESYKQVEKINHERLTVIRSEVNLGFAGGNNFGLRYAKKTFGKMDYVFLLNTDAYCIPNLLFELTNLLRNDPIAASVTPRITTKDGRPWYEGGMFDKKKGKVSSFISLNEANKKPYYEVDVFCGCAVLFNFDILLQAGMLNEKLFLYYEEACLSMQLHNMGYKNLYTPHFTVVHDVSYSTRKVSFLKTYYMTRNKFILFDETMFWYFKIYFLFYQFAFHIKNKRFKNAYYHIKGYIDFKRGRSGKLQIASNSLFQFTTI